MSTDSGIPDYRGESGRRRTRTPIQHRDFLRDEAVRRRYWARSFVGFPHIAKARPNAAHLAVAELEHSGVVVHVVTQNVDELHQAAGSRRVLELHGALSRVVCLGCGARTSRAELQVRLALENGGITPEEAVVAPDGDAELPAEATAAFRVPACLACGGVLKPDVVFFGDNVPRAIVDEAFGHVERAEALLVLGTSLTVFSGFRFVRRAAERNIPIAIVNVGETRGDPLATVRVDASLGEVLPRLAADLPLARGA
jgi:NAD-dependent SIR2 family protein deacetylase